MAGFDLYAGKIAAMFGPGDPVLVDLMEGLFHIAMADGDYHPHEDAFLREVARIFGVDDRCFRSLLTRLVPDAPRDQIRLSLTRSYKSPTTAQLIARPSISNLYSDTSQPNVAVSPDRADRDAR